MPDVPPLFPRTKLLPPEPPPGVFTRERLNRLIEESVQAHRLTLLIAPAGFGKTTAVQSWSASSSFSRVVWLSLDAQDDSPLQFIRALVAALQTLDPAVGTALRPTLLGQTSASMDAPRVFGLLVNEILDHIPDHFVLILDDLHRLTHPELFTGLDYFLERLPPGVHLLATTRVDPPLALPRLRARAQLAEIRSPDLRFTAAEAARLLNQNRDPGLSEEQVLAIHDRVGGWAAGLHLVARYVVAGHKDTTAALSHPVQGTGALFDLLAAEVLDLQGAELRSFLLETSILEDLTPELCMQVTENPDAPLLLEEAYRRDLFLTSIRSPGEEGVAYRYHDLFREFLLHRLEQEQPDDLNTLHRRAGRYHPNIFQAMQHLLTAGAHEDAAGRLATEAPALFAGGVHAPLRAWIEALPESTRTEHPYMLYFLGACLWTSYEHQAARAALERALQCFIEQGDATGQGEALVLLSTITSTEGDQEIGLELLDRAEPLPISEASRTQLILNRAWIELEQPHSDLTRRLNAALDLVERSEDPGAFHIATLSLRELFALQPEGRQALRRLQRLIEKRVDLSQVGIAQNTHANLQVVFAYLSGDLETAFEAARRSISINEQLGGMPMINGQIVLLMALLERLNVDMGQAEYHLATLETLASFLPGWQAALLFPAGLLAWERGDLEQAREVLARMAPVTHLPEHGGGEFSRLVLRGLVRLRSGEPAEGIRYLKDAVEMQKAHPHLYFFGDMHLALAYAHLHDGSESEGLRALRPALRHWREENLPGVLLITGHEIATPALEMAVNKGLEREFASSVLRTLRRLRAPQPLAVPSTGETLTAREVEVLRLLVSGASNRAIAEALSVSLPTVKTHVSRILAKLNVSSRSQAVAAVRDMKLL